VDKKIEEAVEEAKKEAKKIEKKGKKDAERLKESSLSNIEKTAEVIVKRVLDS